MTGRGAALLLVPLPLVALGAARHALLLVGLALWALGIVVIVIDARRAPGGARLRVTRVCEPTLSVGQPNPVALRIEGAVAPALVRDEHPPRMTASAEILPVLLPGIAEYTLTPHARGEEHFARTMVRAQGPWRLGTRQTAVDTAQTVLVDPDLSQVRSYEALVRRGHLAEMGLRALRRGGEGSDFERVREAVPEDPLHTINWKATARTGRLMASELVPERAQPIVICLDHGRLMGVGAGALTKLDHAINAALLLVHVALRFGDRAGLFAFSDTVDTMLPPRAGATQLHRFIDAVRPLVPGDTEADYDLALQRLGQWQRRRALLVIFTDVLDPDQGAALIRQCAQLRRRHLPLVITVRDPALDHAATAQPTTPELVYRRAVAAGLISDREDGLQLLRRAGVETIDADARTLSPRLVNRYLELKSRGRL